ncbi:hypothetical protein [Arthrobacter pullicola]|uniref:hypothetical protein n=1 Tax=Arthrobacter pullicola TaxID=2762224 RepID=UPI00384EF7AD
MQGLVTTSHGYGLADLAAGVHQPVPGQEHSCPPSPTAHGHAMVVFDYVHVGYRLTGDIALGQDQSFGQLQT